MLHHSANNISLEPLAPQHAPALLQLVNTSREHLGTWLPWVQFMHTEADFEKFITLSQKRRAAGTEYGCMIFCNGEAAGRMGIYNIDGFNATGAIGYWLGTAFGGRGIATDACRLITSHGFEMLNLNRIEIRCGTGNLKSQAVAERLGFVREGTMRQAEKLHEGYIDLCLYSMLKDEWKTGDRQVRNNA